MVLYVHLFTKPKFKFETMVSTKTGKKINGNGFLYFSIYSCDYILFSYLSIHVISPSKFAQ